MVTSRMHRVNSIRAVSRMWSPTLRRSRWVILAGSALAGLGAFLFVVIATRSLGLAGFRPISQLWTVWAIAAAVVTFSTQVVTVRREVTEGQRSISRSAELLPLILLLALTVPLLWVYRVRIFGDASPFWPLVGALIPVGAFLTGKARGWLAVHGTPTQLAAVVGGENLVRAGAAMVLGIVNAAAWWYAVALLAGYGVALLGLRGRIPGLRAEKVGDSQEKERLLPVAASVAGISDHLMLVAAPTVLAASGASSALVSALFVALAVYRAPYQLVLGTLPAITRRFAQDLPGMDQSRIANASRRAGLWLLVMSVLAAASGWALGELVVTPIFAAGGILEPIDHALAAALTILATGALLSSVALLALGRAGRTLIVWIPVTLLTIGAGYAVGEDPTAILAVMTLGVVVATIATGAPFVRSRVFD